MNRLVMMAVTAGAALAAMAMPTRQQLAKAQEMVSDVTAADVAALKAGAKKPAEVAAKHMELAAQAGSEAEKYLLLQGAFHLYVKGEDYDNAAKAIETMQAEIKDFNPEVIVELCGKALVRKMQDNAPRLYAIKENVRRIVFYRKQLPIREAAVRKNPKDPQAQRRLAECHAELGDWTKALEVFAKAGGEFKKMAEGETSGKVPAQELGDFWWDYETKSDTFVYKLHAAELYRKALADDSFKGLARTRADQRVKEVEKDAEVMGACSSRTRGVCQSRIAFKEGESFKIILDAKKKISVDFVACPPGEYVMSNEEQWRNTRHTVKITYPFFIMAWPTTLQDADALVPKVGTHGREVYSPELAKLLTGDTPITDISPADIAAFADALSARMKDLPQFRNFRDYECRLPTEAEWCYVSRTNLNQSAKRGPSKGRDWFWPQRKHLGGGLKYYEFPLWPIYVVREDFDLMSGNKWGVRYVWQNTMLADSYKDIFNGEKSGRRHVQNVGTEIFGYSDEEINPIRICKDKVTCSMGYDSWGSLRVFIRTGQLGSRDPIRFVFGPKISMLNVYPREENDSPVKRIDEEQSTAETIATGQATTSGNAPTPKCKMVNGRPAPLKFELAKGVDLELEGCPAGKFTMGYDFRPEGGWNRDGKAAPKHEVVITRPFWVGKYQVTREQLNVFGLGQVMDEQMRSALNSMDGRGGARCAAACSVADSEYFCRKLTEKFRDQLPIGYVFRLPTDAEWEYASKAGNYLKSNPAMAYGVPGKFFVGSALYADVRKELIQKAMKWDGRVPPGPVGTKSPNDWGVYDAVGNGDEQMLDRLPCLDGDIIRCDKTYKHVVVYLQPAKDKADPLHYQDGSDYYCLVRAETLTKFVFKVGAERPSTFRVCLGPDLVAEKKAKGK